MARHNARCMVPEARLALGQVNLVPASDAASKLLDVGYDAAVPLGDVAAKLARVKLRLVSHGVVSRFRVRV